MLFSVGTRGVQPERPLDAGADGTRRGRIRLVLRGPAVDGLGPAPQLVLGHGGTLHFSRGPTTRAPTSRSSSSAGRREPSLTLTAG